MAGKLSELTVVIKGGGEVASGIAHRLRRSHFKVCLTEIAKPLAVSRGTAFCEAIFDGEKTIEGVKAKLIPAVLEQIHCVWRDDDIPIMVDPQTSILAGLRPDVLIDATMSKKNIGTRITDAPLVIGMGPGFYAGRDVHYIIETNNSNSMGRVIYEGEPEVNTGLPISIGGLSKGRVAWAAQAGMFTSDKQIGDLVVAGEVLAWVEGQPVESPVGGMLRGLLRTGVAVPKGAKLIEVDPVNDKSVCYIIRDKVRAVAGGVLEAILYHYNR